MAIILYLVPLLPYLEPCVVDDDDAIASFYLPFFQMTFNQVVISQSHAAVWGVSFNAILF